MCMRVSYYIIIVLTDNSCVRADWWNLSFYNSKYRVENVPKQLTIIRANSRLARHEALGTQEARVAPGMPRATLHCPLQNPCCFLSRTYIQACWHTHQLINSAFQTSCKVNCPKLVTKFNLVFTRCNILLLTFEQTFTDGAVWLGGQQKQWGKLFSIRGSFACCLSLQLLWELLIDYFELNQVKRARKRLHGMPPSV